MADPILDAFVERIGPCPERTVAVVGIGPGDAGLITVKGAVRLRQADVVLYETTSCPPATWNLVRNGARRVFVGPEGQRPRRTASEQVELIRPHIDGQFTDLLLAAESHPAMILFLDNHRSMGPNSVAGRRHGRGINENLAREILELHTLGVDGG